MKKISLFAAISALVGVFATTAFSAVAADAPVISSIVVMSAGLSSPIRGAVDPSGGIAVTDPRSGGIVRYSASGKLTQFVAVAGSPQGVASTADGRLLVSMGDSVGVFSSAGLKTGSLGAGVGQFKMANGIALDATGTIYVTDSIDNSVQVFQPDGSFSFRFGSTGTGSGQFFMPTGIAYEKASGQIAVVDTNNGRIQFFSTGGSFQKSIGAVGSGPLKFISPQGVAFEYSATGELVRTYILDSYQGNIQALDATGAFLGYIGEYGTKPGQLFVPSDLLFDQAAHRLVVVNGLGNLTTYALAAPGPVDTTPPTLALVDFDPVISETSYLLQGTVEAGATVSVFLGNAQVGGAAKVTGSSWSYTVSGLSVGANAIRISALDAARNEASSTVTLTVNPPNIYTITATAAAGGTITPTATLNSGQSKKFVITPAAGFHIADVVVDGESKGAIKSYTFSKVSDNHSISAIFSNVYTITAAVTSGLGTIDPKTPAVLHQGDDVVLTFTPAAGWHVAKVVVDGSTKPAKTTYALKNLAADHQVAVAFEKNTYKIVAQKSGRGTVTPASTVALHGSTLPIAITPGVGYHVKDVLVDGVSVGDVTSYSFENIDRAHTLKATFAINTYTLTSAAYPAQGGSITAGSVARYGTAKTFTIKPKSGYKIADVKVDGVSIGVKTSYRVGPLTGDRAKDYAIEAYFASTAPLTVSALADGRSAAGQVQNVTGRVSGPSATVTVNGSKAPVIDGIYSAPVILTPGTNTVTITESSAGSDPVTGTRVLVLPQAMPALSVDSPADGTRTDTPVITLSGAVDSGCQVSVAGVPASVSGTRWTATMSLVPGFNTLEVIATDPAGLTSAVKRTVILDTTLPAVAIISPVEDFVTNATEVIVTGFAGAASGVTVSATVNGIPAAVEVVDGTFTVRVATPEERTYVVAVTAADPSGKAATAVRTLIRNATAPRLTLLPPKPGATVLTGSVDSGAVVIIRDANGVVGQAAVTGNTWRLDLADKIYDPATLAVTATDAAGNVTELRL